MIRPETVGRGTSKGQLFFLLEDGSEVPYRAPKNKYQLQQWMELLFGMIISDKACCPGHSSPLDAIAASYFAEAPVVVWKASRGFGGKTTILAGIAMLELLDGADVNILGGSGRQSQRVHEVERAAWSHPIALKDGTIIESPLKKFIPVEPTSWSTQAIMGNRLTALTASTKSARGPHPQRLRMDEVDEMKDIVYDAAMGQAMSRDGIPAQTTLSSTLQYPDGTMAKVLDLAKERGWPVYEWCYKESAVENGGWLEPQEIVNKRNTVTQMMWQIEYDLQEPTAEGRVFTAGSILLVFRPQIGLVEDRMNSYYEFEKPRPDGRYATGADWAKEVDTTVIATIRYDIHPARLVAFERVQIEPYPLQIARLERRVKRYPGYAVHDASGHGGSVISDFIDIPGLIDYRIRTRPELFADYIMACEGGRIESPMVESLHKEHSYCSHADIYGSGHPPDGMVAMALGWQAVLGKADKAAKKRGRIGRVRGIGVRR